MPFFIGSDVGGTFTDLWVADSGGQPRVFKSPTSSDVLAGILDAMRMASDSYGLAFADFCRQIQRFGHGTTVGLNALLTGSAACTAILTTRGFGDTLEIGRMRRQTAGLNEIEFTDSYLRNRHPPLVPRCRIIEIDERIDASGTVIKPLDEDSARAALRRLCDDGVEALAICTLWSTRNPVHENRLRELARQELPAAYISLSHEVSPAVGEYARMSTTAANAALGPLSGRYLARLETCLRSSGMTVPVLMMTCAGGLLPAEILGERPVYALFSGPAAGVIGSHAIARRLGLQNVLTTDVGGTSFDVGVVAAGRPLMRGEIALAGAELRVHSIDVDSIGAGGGSIASVEFGQLRVGPQSAGATPGPACYGRGGTRPTATDADLVLGVLDPDNFLGGRMKLDVAAAERAIGQHVAGPLGLTLVEAAWAIREVLDNRMADLLRRATIERGYDPRDFALFANGGAGPSHAWVLADELGLDGFIVPAAATAQSAFGAANCGLSFTAESPAYVRLQPGAEPSPDQLAQVATAARSALEQVRRHLARAAVRQDLRCELFLSLRYRGQTHHLDVPIREEGLIKFIGERDGLQAVRKAGQESNGFSRGGSFGEPRSFSSDDAFDLPTFQQAVKRFESDYETLFGRGAAFSAAGFELLAVRAVGTGVLPPPALSAVGQPLVPAGSRSVVFRDPRAPLDTAIFRTEFPRCGETADGPAIIEYPGQSVVVPPRFRARADEMGNLHVGRPA